MAAKTEDQPPLVGFSSSRVDDVTTFEVHGAATTADVVTIFRGFLLHPTPLVLWDMRDYALAHLGDDALASLGKQVLCLESEKRICGKSAFVCPRETDYRVMRTLIRQAGANSCGIRLGVFRSIEDARSWLTSVRLPS